MEATLREVCEKYGVSRRAIQGYEKEGLVMAARKNKMGHLLYDDVAQAKIEKIHVYQELGFSIKEIKAIIDAPKESVIPILDEQVAKLREEKVRIEELIQIAYKLLEEQK